MTDRMRFFVHRIALAGALLGVAAGLVQATAGSRIPEWTGSKDNPVGLGALTAVLSLLAWIAAQPLATGTPLSPARRLVVAAGLVVPGGLCFTTVGRLWYLPGALLIAGTIATLSTGTREVAGVAREHLLGGMVGVLGAFEVLMAISTRPLWLAAIGVLGGLTLVVAPWPTVRRSRVVLLVIGALPFPALTWWSVATPVLGVVALTLGVPATRRGPTTAPVRPAVTSPDRSPLRAFG